MPAITSILLGVTAATAVAGTAVAAVGLQKQVGAAKDAAAANKEVANQQAQQDAIRQKAMENDARRQRLEIIRQAQIAHSQSLTNAVSQNAQLGSGLYGGYGQISGREFTNLLGVDTNLLLGRDMFASNQIINQQRFKLADASSAAATGAGYSSFGNSLLNASGAIGKLSGGFGNAYSSAPSYQSPQAYSYNTFGPIS
jgi:hypothetical protein